MPTEQRDPGRDAIPSPWRRLAGMIYESLLLFGITFVAGYALLAAARWTYPLADGQRWALQGLLFVVIGAYFAWCWSRGGQTLAMKSWGLRLVDRDGRPPSPARAVLRYLLAWHLFAPGLAAIALLQAPPLVNIALFVGGFALMLAAAWLDPQRQLLHDRLLGMRVLLGDVGTAQREAAAPRPGAG